MLATIAFFEQRGKTVLKQHDREHTWYADFLEFVERERVFATLLTPARDADGSAEKRWDTKRICAFNEITAFYGLVYWYTWQVSILGLGPIWQSENEAARRRAAELLDGGSIFAFGLSEQAHGADIYSTDMVLTPDGGRLSRQRRQVLHRQRQPRRDGLGLRPPRRRRRPGRLRVLRRRQRPPRLPVDQERRQLAVLRLELRARRLPGPRRGRPAHRPGGVRRGAEHGQHRQVQPRLRLDRDLRARLLRGDHARRRTGPLRDAGDRLPPRAPGVHRRVRAPGRDEAVRAIARSTTCAPPARTIVATCSTTRSRR